MNFIYLNGLTGTECEFVSILYFSDSYQKKPNFTFIDQNIIS